MNRYFLFVISSFFALVVNTYVFAQEVTKPTLQAVVSKVTMEEIDEVPLPNDLQGWDRASEKCAIGEHEIIFVVFSRYTTDSVRYIVTQNIDGEDMHIMESTTIIRGGSPISNDKTHYILNNKSRKWEKYFEGDIQNKEEMNGIIEVLGQALGREMNERFGITNETLSSCKWELVV